jgi:hypothetical protein
MGRIGKLGFVAELLRVRAPEACGGVAPRLGEVLGLHGHLFRPIAAVPTVRTEASNRTLSQVAMPSTRSKVRESTFSVRATCSDRPHRCANIVPSFVHCGGLD